MMKASLIAAFAALLALAPAALAAPGKPPADVATPGGVKLAVKIASVVAVPAGQEDVTVPVTLTLTNVSYDGVALESSNRCQIRIWKVIDSKDAGVENHTICTMEYAPQSNTLAAGERQSEDESITLHAAKYREGETYTLRYRFWGIFAEAKFTVKQAQ
ncbi:MAG: hypothetical protein ABSD21_09870 [Rhizomicrobium sp.]|jgi:hypothetical protein